MKPVYRPVKDDGAKWRCKECDQLQPASKVWHYQLPNGNSGILCRDCIDPQWLKNAEFNPHPAA
jgi:hypothetical protein